MLLTSALRQMVALVVLVATLSWRGAARLVKRTRNRVLLDLNLPPPEDSKASLDSSSHFGRYKRLKDLPDDLKRRYATARDSQSRRARLQRIRQAPPDEPAQLTRGSSSLSNQQYLDREKERQVKKNRVYYSDPQVRQKYNEYSKKWYHANKIRVLAKQRQETQLIQRKRKADQAEGASLSSKRPRSTPGEQSRIKHLETIKQRYKTDDHYREAKRQYQKDYQRRRKSMLKEIKETEASDTAGAAVDRSSVRLTKRSNVHILLRRANGDQEGQGLDFDLNKSPPAMASPPRPTEVSMSNKRRRRTLSDISKQHRTAADRLSRQSFLKRVRESDPKAPVEYSIQSFKRAPITNEQLLERKRLQNIESQHRQRSNPERRKAINERSKKYYASHRARMRELDHQRYLRRREDVLAKYKQKKLQRQHANDATAVASSVEPANPPVSNAPEQ